MENYGTLLEVVLNFCFVEIEERNSLYLTHEMRIILFKILKKKRNFTTCERYYGKINKYVTKRLYLTTIDTTIKFY